LTEEDKNKKAFNILYEALLKERYARNHNGNLEGFEEWLKSCHEMCKLMCEDKQKYQIYINKINIKNRKGSDTVKTIKKDINRKELIELENKLESIKDIEIPINTGFLYQIVQLARKYTELHDKEGRSL